ncbi:MAG: gamma-glutamylcyclotransferase [Leptospiraceae bacterium]|nr:gamma-glutamylcyclotransferase [Leptospiraceae bacterium]
MSEMLFVYGTLRADYEHPCHHIILTHGTHVSHAWTHGRLYLIDYYPGLILSRQSGERVHGELYRLDNPGPVFLMLDAYEGCGPDDASPTEYVRRMVHVFPAPAQASTTTAELESDQPLEAWTYIYNWSVPEDRRILSGDFLNR